MKSQRRSFSPEFKHDSASLVVQGYSMAEAERAVDVHENTPHSAACPLQCLVSKARCKKNATYKSYS
jgi:transposase-like protein